MNFQIDFQTRFCVWCIVSFLTNIPKLLLRFIGLVTNQFNHTDQLIQINKIAL